MLLQQSDFKVCTSEGIIFSLPLAGPVIRFLAFLIDFFVILSLNKIIQSFITVLFIIDVDIANSFYIILFFIINIGYNIVLETYWNGQTIGKKLFRIKVIDQNNFQAGFQQILLRNLLRFVDMLPGFYLVGGLTMFFSKKMQRLGDIAGNTLVIRSVNPSQPAWEQLSKDKYNSLLAYPHFVTRLRNKVSQLEAELALESIIRRDEMLPEKRIVLFEEVADHFKEIVNFPQEALEGVSDEQFIRNVVQILFNKK